MINILGSTLPEFSSNNKETLKQCLDFIGINHYTSYYVQDCIFTECEPGMGGSKTEGFYQQGSLKNGVPIGESVRNLIFITIIVTFQLYIPVAEALSLCRPQ